MADQTNQRDSMHRVAYDLTMTIAAHETGLNQDRAYWLRLYQQSFFVVNYGDPEKVIPKA